MRQRLGRWSVTFLFVLGCLTPALPAAAAGADEAAVRQAATQFYAALNALFGGDVAPMVAVWSHAADVTYMGPAGGMQVGWPAIEAKWTSQAAMKLGGAVEPTDVHVTVGETLAVMQNYEKGTNTNLGGKPATVSIRVTNTFRKEGGTWKMIGHHTDLLEQLAQ